MGEVDALLDILESLMSVVPKEHHRSFMHVRSKIAYTAPELLGLRWCNIHDILVKISAKDEEASWVNMARDRWNAAYAQRSDQCKIVTDAVLGPRVAGSFPQRRR